MSHAEPPPAGPDAPDAADATPDATDSSLDEAGRAPAAPETRAAWWGRNRMWVRLLIPLLLLAIAATSFRVVRILLPIIDWSAPQVAHGSELAFKQPVHVAPGKTVQREVTIRVDGVREMASVDGYLPDPGAHLYQVDLAFEARSDVPLSGCYVYLQDAQGTLYGSLVGTTQDPAHSMGKTPWPHCVPPDTYDPQFDSKTGERLPVPADAVQRPSNWSNYWAIALPASVEPARVVVRWYNNQPEYAVLDLPR